MLGNWFKTGMLMAAIMALFGIVGALLGGGQGMLLALAFGAAMNLWAISRGREYEADRGGAEVSGDPRALADALAKIERHARGVPLETAEMHPATAQMMIINPLSGGGISALFRTHPPTEERIHRLLAMAV